MSIVDSETIRAVPAFGILFTEGIHSGYNQKGDYIYGNKRQA